jgi:hypothetical protein
MAVRHKPSNRYDANLGRNTMGIKSVTLEVMFEPDHIPILVNLGLLKPLGRPPASAVKYFASIEIEALRNDPKWLAKASDALREKWKAKNERAANSRTRQTTSGNGQPLRNGDCVDRK